MKVSEKEEYCLFLPIPTTGGVLMLIMATKNSQKVSSVSFPFIRRSTTIKMKMFHSIREQQRGPIPNRDPHQHRVPLKKTVRTIPSVTPFTKNCDRYKLQAKFFTPCRNPLPPPPLPPMLPPLPPPPPPPRPRKLGKIDIRSDFPLSLSSYCSE